MQGYIRQRGPGSWDITVSLGNNPVTGNYDKVSKTVHGTKRDAEAALAELLVTVNRNGFAKPKEKLTVGEFLTERWLVDYCEPNLSSLTLKSYQQTVNLHLVPALGAIPLTKLAPAHVQSYYSQALKSGRKDGKGHGLSKTTVLYHHRILHEALRHAVMWELVGRNVTDAVIPPSAEEYEVVVWSDEELAELLAAAEGTPFYIPVLLALNAGLRRGEVLGGQWRYLDMAGLFKVREQLKQAKGDGGGGYTFAPPKRKSKRDVPLPADILPDLKRHKAEQAKHRLALGPGYYREKDLIVCLSDGRPWQPDNFSSDFAEFLTKAGLPHMRFHDLRHTYATKLLEAGVDIKTVSEHLGHTSIKVTADKYGHVTPRMKDRSAETMGQILARIRDHQNRRKGETDDRDSAAEK